MDVMKIIVFSSIAAFGIKRIHLAAYKKVSHNAVCGQIVNNKSSGRRRKSSGAARGINVCFAAVKV